jgi:hypothetical protein
MTFYEFISIMGGHHLILGTLSDLLTGEVLDDTLDERYRQKIAGLLVNHKGFLRSDIEPRRELRLQADDRRAVIKVDFVVRVADRAAMVIRFGPGSLVSRERPALAISRLVEPYQIPVVVVTNGEDAEIMDGGSGKVFGRGLAAIPSKTGLAEKLAGARLTAISPDRAAMESRIAYATTSTACRVMTICRLMNAEARVGRGKGSSSDGVGFPFNSELT